MVASSININRNRTRRVVKRPTKVNADFAERERRFLEKFPNDRACLDYLLQLHFGHLVWVPEMRSQREVPQNTANSGLRLSMVRLPSPSDGADPLRPLAGRSSSLVSRGLFVFVRPKRHLGARIAALVGADLQNRLAHAEHHHRRQVQSTPALEAG